MKVDESGWKWIDLDVELLNGIGYNFKISGQIMDDDFFQEAQGETVMATQNDSQQLVQSNDDPFDFG